MSDDDIANHLKASGGCDIITFVPATDTGQYLTDGLYQARANGDKKSKPVAAAAFGLLLAGMRARNGCALVKFTMRGSQPYALLTPTPTCC